MADRRFKTLTIKNLMTGLTLSKERTVVPMYKIHRILEQDYQLIKKNIEIQESKKSLDGDSRLIIFKIPSEKYPTELKYTVGIRFFTEDDRIDENTQIQVGTNAPDFNFQYAYLFNKAGFLLPEFKNVVSKLSLIQPPVSTNPKRIMGISKSLWFAIRYLQETVGKDISKDIKDYSTYTKIQSSEEMVAESSSLKKKYKTKNQSIQFKY